MKLLLAIVILSVSAIAAFAQAGDAQKPANESEIPRITVEEAKKALDAGNAVFVDSRATEAYRAEHIKGAIIIEGAADDRFDKLPKGKKIIVYCS